MKFHDYFPFNPIDIIIKDTVTFKREKDRINTISKEVFINGVKIKWIKKANADIDTVKILLKANKPYTEIIGFHCQQADEKYLKAYLVFINMRVPKTHDIDSLLQMCILKDFVLSGIK